MTPDRRLAPATIAASLVASLPSLLAVVAFCVAVITLAERIAG